jgi:ankyrin repeat protein
MENEHITKEIWSAIKQGDIEKVVSPINGGKVRLEMMTPFGTWLHVAAHHGQLEIAKRLVAWGADINRYGGIAGGGPLNEAAAKGHVEIVKYLLSCGAELDVSEPERNPLFSAIYGGYIAIVKLLIENGLNAHVKYTGTSMNNTDALAFANERGQTEIAEMLASLG